jgi:hypothetical protein
MYEPQIITSRNITIFAEVQIVETKKEFVFEKIVAPHSEVREVISESLINAVTNSRSPDLKSRSISVFETAINLIFVSRIEKVVV